MNTTTFGVDLAKRVFQVHWVDMETGEVKRRQLRRDQLVTFFAKQAPALIAMEACGSSHYWARHFVSFGHQVRLIAPSFVRPFVKCNKTDLADAQAIWEAAQRPEMRFVAVKSEAQQSVLTLHRVREQMVKMRQMQVNQIHGLLYEFGVAVHAGRQGMADAVRALAELADTLPAMVVDTLREQLQRIDSLARDIAAVERRLTAWKREDDATKRVMAIPGVGLLTATAATATIGDAHTFRSGREFAAFLGLVPRQSGTGGRIKLLGISKQGDIYLRTLLIHGARSVLKHLKKLPESLQRMMARRPFNVVAVALANRMARTIWALLAHDRTYNEGYVPRSTSDIKLLMGGELPQRLRRLMYA